MQAEIAELQAFASVLDTAIPAHDREVIALAVDLVGAEWREVGENFPGRTDTSVKGGLEERLQARGTVRDMVLSLRRIAMAAQLDDFDQAAQIYVAYKQQVVAASTQLKLAENYCYQMDLIHESVIDLGLVLLQTVRGLIFVALTLVPLNF